MRRNWTIPAAAVLALAMSGCSHGNTPTSGGMTAPAATVTATAVPSSPPATTTSARPSSPTTTAVVTPTAARPPVSESAGIAADALSADEVALKVGTAILAWDTRVDRLPADTGRRAAAWMTPAMAARVQSFVAQSAPGADWLTWQSHQAHAVVTATLEGDAPPPDTRTTALRPVTATVTPTGADGWVGAPATIRLFLTLEMTPTGWRLARVVYG